MELLQQLIEQLSIKNMLACQQRLIELGFDAELTKGGNLLIKAEYEGKQYVNHESQYTADPQQVAEDAAIWLIGAIDYDQDMAPDNWLDEAEALKVVSYMLDTSKQVKFMAVPTDTVWVTKNAMKADGWELLADSEDPFDAGVELIFGKRK